MQTQLYLYDSNLSKYTAWLYILPDSVVDSVVVVVVAPSAITKMWIKFVATLFWTIYITSYEIEHIYYESYVLCRMNKGFLYIQKDKHKWLDDLLFHIQRSAHNSSFDTGLYTPLAYIQDFWDIRN